MVLVFAIIYIMNSELKEAVTVKWKKGKKALCDCTGLFVLV